MVRREEEMKVYFVGDYEVAHHGLVVLADSIKEVAKILGGEFIPKERALPLSSESMGVIRFKKELFNPPASEEEMRLHDGLWSYRRGSFEILIDSEDQWGDEKIYEIPWMASPDLTQLLGAMKRED